MNDIEQVTEITLRFDWRVGPLWVSIDGDVPDNYGPDDITEVVSLSNDLRIAIAEWDDRMQSTYNEEVPQDSGLHDEAEQKFIADGRELAWWLKNEVGAEVRVEYAPIGGPTELMEG